MTFSGNVDVGTRNRWSNFGDVPDYRFGTLTPLVHRTPLCCALKERDGSDAFSLESIRVCVCVCVFVCVCISAAGWQSTTQTTNTGQCVGLEVRHEEKNQTSEKFSK